MEFKVQERSGREVGSKGEGERRERGGREEERGGREEGERR